MKKIIVIAGLIATVWVGMQATPAQAEVNVSIVVGEAPPPLPYEAVPSPRYGYIWVPGYWDWSGSEYSWHEGYWLAERVGYVYQAPYWYFGSGGWYRHSGGWHNRPYQQRNDADEREGTGWGYDWQNRQPRYETGRSAQQDYDRHRDQNDAHGERERDRHRSDDREYGRQYQSAPGWTRSGTSQSDNDADQRNGRDTSDNSKGSRNGSSNRPQESRPGAWGYR